MDPLTLAITVIVITTSGALAPGPLFIVTISQGIRQGIKSGILFSIAHNILEFSLVMLLALGLLRVAHEPSIRLIIGIAGGLALIVFGAAQILNSIKNKKQKEYI